MVQFNLPQNSKITEGKTWPVPAVAHNLREYRVYRWDPEDGKNPRLDTYQIDAADCGNPVHEMVSDAMVGAAHVYRIEHVAKKVGPAVECLQPTLGTE